jgi:hypothetical protein
MKSAALESSGTGGGITAGIGLGYGGAKRGSDGGPEAENLGGGDRKTGPARALMAATVRSARGETR